MLAGWLVRASISLSIYSQPICISWVISKISESMTLTEMELCWFTNEFNFTFVASNSIQFNLKGRREVQK